MAILLVLLLACCGSPPQKNEIAGTWTMNEASMKRLGFSNMDARPELVLKADGSLSAKSFPSILLSEEFYRPLTAKSRGKSFNVEGRWNLDDDGKSSVDIVFHLAYPGWAGSLDVVRKADGIRLTTWLDEPGGEQPIEFAKH